MNRENSVSRRIRYDRQHPDGTCRWCSGDVSPPRRTFCSSMCVHEYRIRSDNRYMRECVYKRDKGVCVACKVDTRLIGKQLLKVIGTPTESSVRKMYSVGKNRRVYKKSGEVPYLMSITLLWFVVVVAALGWTISEPCARHVTRVTWSSNSGLKSKNTRSVKLIIIFFDVQIQLHTVWRIVEKCMRTFTTMVIYP